MDHRSHGTTTVVENRGRFGRLVLRTAFGYCGRAYWKVSLDRPNPEGAEMCGKLNVWIFACLLAAALAFAPSAEATVRKTNVLTNVRTKIIPNFDNSGTDVCFVYNANPAPVSVLMSVFPTGTLVLSGDTWTFPLVLGPLSGARVFSWSPLIPASEYCKVMAVR
jgi:hypothetical protein